MSRNVGHLLNYSQRCVYNVEFRSSFPRNDFTSLKSKPNSSLIPLLGPMSVSWRGLNPAPNAFIPLVLFQTLKNTGKGSYSAIYPRTTLGKWS
jgi:hypothetical protein